MFDWLAERARISPHKPAVTIGDRVWTYRDLDQVATAYAARLLEMGLAAHDRIGLLMRSSLDYVELIHAIMRIGAIVVPLNTRLTPREIAGQVQLANCAVVIVDASTEAKASELTNQIVPVSRLTAPVETGHLPESKARSRAPGARTLDQTAALLFTSGTTGQPKAVPLTFGNFFYSAQGSAWRLGTLPDDQWLCVLPLFHVGGLSILLRACLYGIGVHLHEKFDVEHINATLQHTPITLISLVPTMLYRLLMLDQTADWQLSLRLILLGGAAAFPDLLALDQARNLPIATTYGLTEAASQVATAIPPQSFAKPGSVGQPLWGTSVTIVDEARQPVATGEWGEIVVSGPTVTSGCAGGQLYTGDVGYQDDDGDLWVLQRRSDLIVTGGENVYPVEVERILCQHPAVAAACVVGVDHPEWGQQVAAAVILEAGISVTANDLQTFCRVHLAGYKLPRQIRFVPRLPETSSGKIKRAAVVELFR